MALDAILGILGATRIRSLRDPEGNQQPETLAERNVGIVLASGIALARVDVVRGFARKHCESGRDASNMPNKADGKLVDVRHDLRAAPRAVIDVR
ncbi:hypothetical protein FKP32DRAFT_1672335 [Trametes sanguinea]|nr:hypothetical protein FKP32DRAFT_1672335 [Trametes sanguinea]